MLQPAAPDRQVPTAADRLQPLAGFSGSLGQRVYQTLRQAILSLEYRPGEILRKPDICEALEVSRSPVADAVARLQAEGLVDVIPQAGTFVAPDDLTFKAAAAAASWDKSFFQILTDQPGAQAWPITGATFILLHKTADKPAVVGTALKFFDWAFTSGDKMATELEYVSLPDSVESLVRRSWGDIKDASGKAVAVK